MGAHSDISELSTDIHSFMLCIYAYSWSLQAVQVTMPRLYSDFACSVPAETVVTNDDIIRMVTIANGSDEWLSVAGDLITIEEADGIVERELSGEMTCLPLKAAKYLQMYSPEWKTSQI